MDPFSAVGSIGGSLGMDWLSNSWSKKEALRNRQFQEQMSSTAYRRAVKDLRAAGLNPMIAAMNGGASTPGGSQASFSSMGNALNSGVSTAMAAASFKEDLSVKKLQGKISRDALNMYNNSPNAAKAVQGAAIANSAGLDPRVGAALGLDDSKPGKTVKRSLKNVKQKVTNTVINPLVDWLNDPAIQEHYNRLNSRNKRLNIIPSK